MCNIDKFDTTIKMLNNELASYTWARLTWEQRLEKSQNICLSDWHNYNQDNIVSYYINYDFDFPIVCETLSQMQFVSQNEYKIGEAITILNKL